VDPQTRTRDIWLIDRARGISTRFTFEKTNENYPLWEPDGKRIAYWSAAVGSSGITAKQLTGSGETELLLPSNDELILKDWSRDGSTIVYDLAAPTGLDIWTLSLADKKARAFLNAAFNEYDGHLSPDGRYLAYTSDESGREEIYVQTYPDRSDKWQVSTHGGSDPRWGGRGTEMYYLSPDQQMVAVPIKLTPTFDPGTPVTLFALNVLFPGGQRSHYTVTADGQHFITYRPTSTRSLPTTTVIVNWMSELAKR
jgi:Tol biopolymer transport system component